MEQMPLFEEGMDERKQEAEESESRPRIDTSGARTAEFYCRKCRKMHEPGEHEPEGVKILRNTMTGRYFKKPRKRIK